MENNDKIKAINGWQNSNMHHLTCVFCGKDLFPALKNGEVILNCKCGYIQEWIPNVVLRAYLNKIYKK
ncbi:hypothetical protein [Clostridium cochlearium]|uniref:hypothetical protein n=1 Tax=Clostridium cochlearium TaxID=1494 RepID=UPI0018368BB0|nr:hypothetical protein [Clostridium cochlearium]NMA58231.1 hypothetical protein [Clostridium cochlearium]